MLVRIRLEKSLSYFLPKTIIADFPNKLLETYRAMEENLKGTKFTALAHAASAAAIDGWARAERAAGNFQSALEKFQELTKKYAETLPAAQANDEAAETLLEWAKRQEQAGNDTSATEKYQQLAEQYANTPSAAQAKTKIAALLNAAAQKFRAEKKFEQAVANYETLLKKYPDTPEGAQAKTNAAETLLEWAESANADKNYTRAFELYERLAKDYADTPAGAKTAQGQSALFKTAQTLVAQKQACDSIALLDLFAANAQYSKQAKGALPEALYKCGAIEFQNKNYTKAKQMFDRVLADFATSNYAGRARAALVDVQVAEYRAQGAGELPPPQVSGSAPQGTTVVVISNDSPEKLEVLLSGPGSQSLIIEPCATCEKYSNFGPLYCPEKGPQKRVTLAPGKYGVVVRTMSGSTTTPFYGSWDLDAGSEYFNCFFIVTSFN